jgi:large subunit ribosomal protein L23
MKMPGKTRRFGRRVTRTPSWKKAVITLAPGDRIELFEGV